MYITPPINNYTLGQIVTSTPDGGIGNTTEGLIFDIGGNGFMEFRFTKSHLL